MSPVQSVMVRNGRSSFFSTFSALVSIRSCSSADVSGVVIETSSHLVN